MGLIEKLKQLLGIKKKEPERPKQKKQYSIGLWLSDGCNLSCAYCFQDRKRKATRMNRDTLDHTIKFINETKPIGLTFFGGEPLLNKEGIKEILEKTNVPRYYITTNATLLDGETFDLLAKHKVYMNVSLDGTKETQDTFRDDSYDRVIKHLPKILHHFKTIGGNILLACMISSTLFENVKHIKNLGFPSVYINQMTPYHPRIENEFENVEVFKEQYKKVLEELHDDHFEVGDYAGWRSIIMREEKGQCGYHNAGLGISVKGKLFACHRAPELPNKFSFGNVWYGINKVKEEKIRSITLPKMCQGCELHFNQCPVSSYNEHKKFSVDPDETHCVYEKAKAQIVMSHHMIRGEPTEEDAKPSRTKIAVATLIDPHKLYVLPQFLKHLSRMKFPKVTDYYFIIDEGDNRTHRLINTWMEGWFKNEVPYNPNIVRFFKMMKMRIKHKDSSMDRITRGRDLMLNKALTGNYTHLFFLDADILTKPDTVADLLEVDAPLVSGLVKTRATGRRRSWFNTYIEQEQGLKNPNLYELLDELGEVIDVDATGGDCLLIRRDAMKAVGKFENIRKPNPIGTVIGFCLKAKELGYQTKVHTGVMTKHVGFLDLEIKMPMSICETECQHTCELERQLESQVSE